MSIQNAITKAFNNARERNWDTLYFAIDVHDTIVMSDSRIGKEPELEFCTPCCKEALRLLSNIHCIRTILFTSSYPKHIKHIAGWLKDNNIHVDYLNENPECLNTKTGYFDKKFYYNVIIDDKAGFDPYTDWEIVLETVQREIKKDLK